VRRCRAGASAKMAREKLAARMARVQLSRQIKKEKKERREVILQEGGGEIGGEEDLDELAKEIEATKAADEEKETTVKNKKRRRRRRKEIRERKTKLKEDLSWLENALKRMEKSLLGSKHAELGDLEDKIGKEGSHALQQVLDQFKALQDRKSKIWTELNQLSDEQHVHNKSADPTSSANEVGLDLSPEEIGNREFEMEQQLIKHIAGDQEKKICQDWANDEMENFEEVLRINDNGDLVIEAASVSKVDTEHTTDEEEAGSKNEKEDESNLFCGDREGNRLHEEVTIHFSPYNRKKFEKSLEKVRMGGLQIAEQDKTLPVDKEWKKEREVSEERRVEESGEKCEEMSKDDNEVKKNLMEVVAQPDKRKRWRKKKVKVCWLCAAAKTDEGFDLHWCAGCRKARYCGLGCHEQDWERHKEFCQKVRKGRRKMLKASKREKVGENRESVTRTEEVCDL